MYVYIYLYFFALLSPLQCCTHGLLLWLEVVSVVLFHLVCLVFSCEADRIKPKPSLILLNTRHDHVAYFRYSLSEVNDSVAVERLKKYQLHSQKHE